MCAWGRHFGSGHSAGPPHSCNSEAAHGHEPAWFTKQASLTYLNLNNAQILPIMYFHTCCDVQLFAFQLYQSQSLSALMLTNLSCKEKWPSFEPSGLETSLNGHQEQFQSSCICSGYFCLSTKPLLLKKISHLF